MKARKFRISIVAAFFIALLFLSPQHVLADGGSKFHLGGAPGSLIAVVKEKTLNLAVATGPVEDYDPVKNFNLTIGECSMAVTAFKTPLTPPSIQFYFKVNGKLESVISLTSITIKPSEILLNDTSPLTITGCAVKFGDKKDDGYHVNVTLSGDVPKNFNLTSPDALTETTKEAAASAEVLPMWAIIVIAIGSVIVLAIVIMCFVASFLIRRRRKKKALKREQEVQEQLKTAKSVEAAKTPAPVPTNVAEVKASESADKTDGPKKAKEKKKRKHRKERSKESSENESDRPKDKKARAKESKAKRSERSKKSPKDSSKKEASMAVPEKREEDSTDVPTEEGH